MRAVGFSLWAAVLAGAMVSTGCLGPDEHAYTPLEEAIIVEHDVGHARALLEDGADPNERSKSGGPLGAAVGGSNQELVRLLLSFGADASETSATGGSYLVTAAVQRPAANDLDDVAIARMLIEAGADPCLRSTDRRTLGLTPSEVAKLDGRSDVADALDVFEQRCPD